MKEIKLTFDDISEKADIPVRRLRYVWDHDIIPNVLFPQRAQLPIAPRRGMSRELLPYQAFLISLADLLRQAGLDREGTTAALTLLKDWCSKDHVIGRREWVLRPICEYARNLELQIGDARCIRAGRKSDDAKVAKGTIGLPSNEIPWTLLATNGVMPSGYRPMVRSVIDAGLLAERLGIPDGSEYGTANKEEA